MYISVRIVGIMVGPLRDVLKSLVGGDPQFLWGSFSGDVLDASDFGG